MSETLWASINTREFLAQTKAALAVASKDEARPNLAGALLDVCRDGGACVRLVATDGHRLTEGAWSGEAAPGCPRGRLLAPDGLRAAVKAFGKGRRWDVVKILGTDGGPILRGPGGDDVPLPLLDGAFPDYGQLLSDEREADVVLKGDVRPFKVAVKAISAFAGTNGTGAAVMFDTAGDDYITLRTEADPVGGAEAWFPGSVVQGGSGKLSSGGFTGRYLLDALDAHSSDRFRLAIHGMNASGRGRLFHLGVFHDAGARHVIMARNP